MFARRCFVISLIWMLWLAAQGPLDALSAAPLKALIVDGQNYHNWQQTTPVLKKLLEETGLFAVDVATSPPQGKDMSRFQPDFSAYNVVVMNYHGDDWPEATQKALEQYMSRRRRAGDRPRGLPQLSQVEGVQRDDRTGRLGQPHEKDGPVRVLEGRPDRRAT